jgi:hypothetical protein
VPSPRRGEAQQANNFERRGATRWIAMFGLTLSLRRAKRRCQEHRAVCRTCRGLADNATALDPGQLKRVLRVGVAAWGPNGTGRKLLQPVARPKQTGKWAMASFPRCRRAGNSPAFRASSLISRAAMLSACSPKIRSHCWRTRIGVRSARAYFLSFNITSSALACGLSRHSFTKASVCFSSVSTLNFESPDLPSRKPWRKAIATSRF